MSTASDPLAVLTECFGPGATPSSISVPGRVNLIGEHIDYHNLPVLPMAIPRRVRAVFRPNGRPLIRAASLDGYGVREIDWTPRLDPAPAGDWANYILAAAQAVRDRWGLDRGIDAAVVSDLPPAAGLSSSSALMTAFTLALLEVNGVRPAFEELMEVLPEAEYFVGTRGGGMDHAAVLESRAGCALFVAFAPLTATPVRIPDDWTFLVAHSLTHAEKSGALRAEYNARRAAGTRALARLGFKSYAEAISGRSFEQLRLLAAPLDGEAGRAFLHVAGEALRVGEAVRAMSGAGASRFAALLTESHASARDLLRISCPALDRLVECALQAGAPGARLTGAGFGGCAIVFCPRSGRPRIREELVRLFYSDRPGFDPGNHLIDAEPAAGALHIGDH
jgi:galactokinase